MDQALVNHARRADMAATIVALGGVRDRYDPHKYRRAGDVLNITGEQFYIHTRGQGGAWPISLVMQLTGRSSPESVTYLVGQGGQRPAADPPPLETAQGSTSSKEHARAPFTAPARDEEAWPRVRAYLTTERALPPAVIDDLHGRGLIYADHHANAVFLRRSDDGCVTGAALCGRAANAPDRAGAGVRLACVVRRRPRPGRRRVVAAHPGAVPGADVGGAADN